MGNPDTESPSPSSNDKSLKVLLEALFEMVPLLKTIRDFFIQEGKVVKSGWGAFVVICGVGFYLGWHFGGYNLESVKKERDDLKRDNQLLGQRNTDLQVTVAPLLARAAREFPGEEINSSLNKVLERLSASDPLHEPIASASATATVDFLTDHKPGANIGWGGVIILVSGSSSLLTAQTLNNTSLSTVDGQGRFRIIGNCSIDDKYMGKPVSSLIAANGMGVIFNKNIVAPNTKALGGQVVWVINNRVTLKFDVPAQTTRAIPEEGSLLMINNLADGLGPLKTTASH